MCVWILWVCLLLLASSFMLKAGITLELLICSQLQHKHTHMALNIDMSWARVAIYVVFHVSTIIKQTQYWSSKIDTFLRIVNDFNWMQWSIFIHFVFDRKQQVKGGSLLLLLSQINNFRIWKNNSVRAVTFNVGKTKFNMSSLGISLCRSKTN